METCCLAPRVLPVVLTAIALTVAAAGCHGRRSEISPTHEHLDFNQDVQPILASNCFSCHGPDPEMRKAGLRLDLEESAFRKRPGKPDAIVPGNPESGKCTRGTDRRNQHTR